METLKQKRGAVKGFFTKFHNFLATELSVDREVDVVEVEARLAKAESQYQEFEQLQLQIESIAPEEISERDEFDTKYFKIVSAARVFLNSANRASDKRESNVGTVQQQGLRPNKEIQSQNLKACIERFAAFVNGGYNDTVAELEIRLHSLTAQWSKFEAEFPNAAEVELENSYFGIYGLAQTILKAKQQQSSSLLSNDSIRSSSKIKLPTINLPVFNGAYSEWLHFHDTFQSLIHSDPCLTKVQKFHYLRSSLRREAASVIQSLEVSDDNYEIAWTLIKERFQNKRLIIHNHIKGLFELQAISKESHVALRELIDNVQKHLRSLKALGQPTDSWDTPMIYLINSKLDHVTRREWEEANTSVDQAPLLKELTTFLTNRCNLLETLNLSSKAMNKPISNMKVPFSRAHERTTSYLSTEETIICKICRGDHSIVKCDEFLQLEPQERTNRVKRIHLCLNCLKPGHFIKQCRVKSGCRVCNKRHHTMLHFVGENKVTIPESQTSKISPIIQDSSTNCHSWADQVKVTNQVLLSTALVQIEDVRGNFHECRALLDVGSQSHFITSTLCARLGIRMSKVNMPVHGINQTLTKIKHRTTVTVKSNYKEFTADLNCLVLDEITGNLPYQTFSKIDILLPDNIKLADEDFNVSRPIDLLIGADLFWNLLINNGMKLKQEGPYFQETALGWVIGGRTNFGKEVATYCNCTMTAIDEQLTRFWEVEGHELKSSFSEEEQLCEKEFVETHKRDQSGRFVVKLPLRCETTNLGSSRDAAEVRFRAIERKFKNNEQLRLEYSRFMKEYEMLGHMEVVPDDQINSTKSFYLPHHPVFKASSITTKLRVVFDASAKTTTGTSLNDILMVGPTIQHDLFSIICRFRVHKIAMTADISKMYRQVLVRPEDRDLQRIIWRENESHPIQIYRLKTVTYGTAPASFLAIRSLQQCAIDGEREFLCKDVILNDFYVDDLITGTNSIEEAKLLRERLTKCLEAGGFELRQWASNCLEVLPAGTLDASEILVSLDKQGNTRALGLDWNCLTDLLKYEVTTTKIGSKVTKRIILSTIAKLFDPLGLITPILIAAKVLIQQLWAAKLNWDQSIPHELRKAWFTIVKELQGIAELKIPRRVTADRANRIEIHTFCDASEKAYGCCVYIRTIDDEGKATTNLLCSKSRVAPLKTLVIARLELCGAVLAARLTHKVIVALNLTIHRFYYWTDSTTVLAWLNAAPSIWKTFVAHRVAEIQSLTNIQDWVHVDTKRNSADLISRGSSPANLLECNLWWHGPEFMSDEMESWPPQIRHIADSDTEERRNVSLIAAMKSDLLPTLEKYSSFSKLQRVVAYALRFSRNCRKGAQGESGASGTLTSSELQAASNLILKTIQENEFADELAIIKRNNELPRGSRLVSLHPFIDDVGLLRVGGRLQNSLIHDDKKHPILLPAKHHVTKLIVRLEHERQLHAGNQATLASLRNKYWILAGRGVVRKVIHDCVRCFRIKPRPISNLMGNLPASRVQPSRPFLNTGVDYAGPVYLVEGRGRGKKRVKAYIALFICFSVKAVHLELVGSLTTESFLAALKRFISRRGRVLNLYSDNATNFVGAHRELRELAQMFKSEEFKNTVSSTLVKEDINWHFIPPRSPNFGGLWESNIKGVKNHIKRVLGDAAVTYEEMYTLLVQIEACLNSRPLCPLSNDPNDLCALTPGHFLIGAPLTATVEPNITLTPVNRLSRWQRIEQLRQHFWRRWYREYIPGLQPRSKWRSGASNPDITVGTMVVIRDENLPPLKWQLGRIIDTHSGTDGLTRVVSIRTGTGIVKRGIGKICLLPNQDGT